ncbi:MAG: bifunctional DNA primase/polymerase [Gemmataceae bacterium]|nr:bifunctional DNA primase/polymerase [Gemmataceae bacterium]
MSAQANQFLDAALEYAAKGWAVFPLAPGTKVPTAGSVGHKAATTDADTIRRWWTTTPDANIGLATGAPSGVWALDVDLDTETGKDGNTDLDSLQSQFGELPPTRVHLSPRGGGHFIFNMPTGIDVRNRAGINGMALDARGTGGYLVLPPSRTDRGVYNVAADLPITDAPQWLLYLVVRPSTPAPATPSLQSTLDIGDSDRLRRARAYLDKIPGGVDGEHGSNPCLWAASVLVWGYCLDRATARQLMGEYSARCSPPWSEKEIEHKLDDAAKGGIGKPQGWLLDAPRNNTPVPSASSGGAMTEPERPRFDWIDSADFDEGDYRPTYLIECALVANEPAILAAPTKSMKTSIGVDACISMAAGLPFLGRFHVPAPIKVAIASMESGKNTLQGTMRRVCKSKGITPADLTGQLVWTFNVPRFDQPAAVAEFVLGLEDRGVKAVLLDPAYLCLGEVDEKSIFDVGRCLRSVAEMMVPKGITPLIVHHANRGLTTGEKMDLQHIAYSGFDAFARQFWLANRRDKYTHDGNHKLWLSVGGSAGHGGLYAVDIAEGLTDRNFGGRYWDVTVVDAVELRQDAAEDREAKAAAKVREKMAADMEAVLKAIESELSKGQPAATANAIKLHTGWQSKRVNDTIDRMLDDGLIEDHDWKKTVGKNATRDVTGYRRPSGETQSDLFGDHAGESDLPHDITACSHDPGSVKEHAGDHAGELSPLKGDTPALPHDPEPRELEATPMTGRRRKAKSPACSRKAGAA